MSSAMTGGCLEGWVVIESGRIGWVGQMIDFAYIGSFPSSSILMARAPFPNFHHMPLRLTSTLHTSPACRKVKASRSAAKRRPARPSPPRASSASPETTAPTAKPSPCGRRRPMAPGTNNLAVPGEGGGRTEKTSDLVKRRYSTRLTGGQPLPTARWQRAAHARHAGALRPRTREERRRKSQSVAGWEESRARGRGG